MPDVSTRTGICSVHPHTRGEHSLSWILPPGLPGSSPHPWGTWCVSAGPLPDHRFIPTPVGNIVILLVAAETRTVHPHTRGEHDGSVGQYATHPGSSPHPWGTYQNVALSYILKRFIPTPVGNIDDAISGAEKMAVHPHTRGEHLAENYQAVFAAGSSPHPWGTFARPEVFFLFSRFIPTPVGNIWTWAPVPASPAVHPHTRGEHLAA